jgi:hypothetical protein
MQAIVLALDAALDAWDRGVLLTSSARTEHNWLRAHSMPRGNSVAERSGVEGRGDAHSAARFDDPAREPDRSGLNPRAPRCPLALGKAPRKTL